MDIIQILIGILLILFSTIFISIAGVMLIDNYEKIREYVPNYLTNRYVLIIGALSCGIIMFAFMVLLIQRNNYIKGCPQYQQITEPIYKKI